MYIMQLADGTAVPFAGMNGSNFITPDKTAVDTSIFTEENLTCGSITAPDGTVEEFSYWAFVQQQRQRNGEYYVSFRERTENERNRQRIAALEEQLAAAKILLGVE